MRKRSRLVLWAAVAAILPVVLSLAVCRPAQSTPDAQDLAEIQSVLMSSYYAERGGTPAGARALTPFAVSRPAAERATVPVPSTPYVFSTLAALTTPTSLSGYPEPGQTTSFAVTVRDATYNVYDVTATTTYPPTDKRETYVEEYYVRDGGLDSGSPPQFLFTTPDDTWTVDDPIVKLDGTAWVQDQMARVRQVLTFADGTTRDETIVAQTDFAASPPAPKFAAFEPEGSLDFGQLFYPETDTDAVFSSVVTYFVTPATSPDFWFWKGTQHQTILGIRYYTEFKDTTAGKYYTYTILFEKSLSTLITEGGSFTSTLQSVFVGSEFNALAESVLRQKVTFGLDANDDPDLATGVRTTAMQTRVVNVTGQQDFFLQQINSDYVQLSGWDTTTIYIPTGNADEVLASDPTAFLFDRTQVTQSSGGADLPVAVDDTTGLGDLAILYTSLTQEAAVSTTTTATPPNSVQADGVAWTFDGSSIGNVQEGSAAYDLTTTGTVETWLYVNQHVDTAGIVHKGVLPDFSDECFSLQFWGNQGQLAFVLDGPNSTAYGGYDLLTSTIKLNTKKWYHLVATWDFTSTPKSINLYINGSLNKSITANYSANGARVVTGAGLVIGSQLPEQYNTLYGYFSLNGKLVGTRVSATPMSATDVTNSYNQYRTLTSGW